MFVVFAVFIVVVVAADVVAVVVAVVVVDPRNLPLNCGPNRVSNS